MGDFLFAFSDFFDKPFLSYKQKNQHADDSAESVQHQVVYIRASADKILRGLDKERKEKREQNTFYRFARQQRCKKTDGNKKSDIAEQIYPKRIVMSVSVIGTDKPENAERFKVYIAVIRKNKFNSVSVQVHFGQKRL